MPVGKGESLSKDIAQVLKVIDEGGLPYDFGSMGTTVEGEWDAVMDLVKDCHDKMLESNNRIYLVIKIDERKGAKDRITGKVKSVEEKLGRGLSK